MNIFEYATRNKLRFPYRGLISAEDLWTLGLEDLDLVFRSLNKELKQVNEESLMAEKSAADQEVEIKIAIVKHIFQIKTEEKNARLHEKEKKEKKQQLLQILANKENEELQNKSSDEIRKMIEELG